MNKKLKEILIYAAILAALFIAPQFVFHYFETRDMETFYERAREDEERCHEKAKRDGVETRWCGDIRDAAKLAYQSNRSGDNTTLLLFFSPLLFVLLMTVRRLGQQVAELKSKVET